MKKTKIVMKNTNGWGGVQGVLWAKRGDKIKYDILCRSSALVVFPRGVKEKKLGKGDGIGSKKESGVSHGQT